MLNAGGSKGRGRRCRPSPSRSPVRAAGGANWRRARAAAAAAVASVMALATVSFPTPGGGVGLGLAVADAVPPGGSAFVVGVAAAGRRAEFSVGGTTAATSLAGADLAFGGRRRLPGGCGSPSPHLRRLGDDDDGTLPRARALVRARRGPSVAMAAAGETGEVEVRRGPRPAGRRPPDIDCEHFGECPGCVVAGDVTSVDVVESARRFFSSSLVRRNTLKPSLPSSSYDDEEEEAFKIVVPSPTTEWRTQAKLAVSSSSTWSSLPRGRRGGRGGGGAGCTFGLYERGTHSVLPIPNCAVHHPRINLAVEVLAEATGRAGIVPYDEDAGTGQLRYVQLQVERNTNKVCLTLVWNAEAPKGCQPALSRLVKELKRAEREIMTEDGRGRLWHSIWCHLNTGAGNAIFARGEGRWFDAGGGGSEFVREPLPAIIDSSDDRDDGNPTTPPRRDGLLHFTPATFRQGNADGFDVLAGHVARSVPPGSAVCELYAGVGVLGLTALSFAAHNDAIRGGNGGGGGGGGDGRGGLKWLRCSDENPANLRCFERAVGTMPTEVTGRQPRQRQKSNTTTKRRNPRRRRRDPTFEELSSGRGGRPKAASAANKQGKVTYRVAPAARALLEGEAIGAEVVIVDPPRRGLDGDVLDQLCRPVDDRDGATVESRDDLDLLLDLDGANLVNDATTLIYVSCGFDAFARDCERLLTSSGGWKLHDATGYILFPGSNHIETVAVFKRRGRRRTR